MELVNAQQEPFGLAPHAVNNVQPPEFCLTLNVFVQEATFGMVIPASTPIIRAVTVASYGMASNAFRIRNVHLAQYGMETAARITEESVHPILIGMVLSAFQSLLDVHQAQFGRTINALPMAAIIVHKALIGMASVVCGFHKTVL